jgi:hypothetical protein
MIKTRLVLPVVAAGAALLVLPGCGGGGGSSSSDPASVAPPESALFLEGTLRPTGSLKTDVEALAKNVAGIEDLGGTIVSELEKSSSSSDITYADDIEPWLGEKAGMAFQEYDGDNFTGFVIAVQSTDTGATEDFLDKMREGNDEATRGSYEGVDFESEDGSGPTTGMIGELLVFAEGEAAFKDAVDASDGESLADVDSYSSMVAHAPGNSLLDAYVDIGGLIEQSGEEVDAQAEKVLETAGIELDEATALASLVPGSDSLELDLVSDLGNGASTSPPASDLLESMPADSFAAVSATEYGKRLQEGIKALDASGIPGQVPPHKLKDTLKKAGIDLEEIAGSLEEVAAFATGSGKATLGGAVVLTTQSATEAKNTVANIGLLLRSNHTPGVTAIGGKAAGFSIHSADIGPKPLVVAAKGDRIAIGYGLPAALEGLTPPPQTLADNPAFGEAAKALGETSMSGFVDGKAALRLAEGLVSPFDSGFQEAKPYLEKIDYAGLGVENEGDLRVAKLIVGLGK